MSQGNGRAEVLGTFAAELRAFHLRCGAPPYKWLRRTSELLPPATVSDVMRGKAVPRLEFVLAFVRGCLRHADEIGAAVTERDRDLDCWQERWSQLKLDLPRKAPAGRAGPNPPDARPGTDPPSAGAARLDPSGAQWGPVPWQLPAGPRRLVGRASELGWLDSTLLGGGAMQVVGEPEPSGRWAPIAGLDGLGGVGKTSLALAWGHQHRDEFPDGQLYLDLRGAGPQEPLTPFEALAALAAGLGLTIPGHRDPDVLAATLRSALADLRMLVVLDNALDEAQVRPLLPGRFAGAVVVTSRSRLRGLVIRDGATRHQVQPLERRHSRLILSGACQPEGPSAQIDEGALDLVAAACADLPLALQLAAERLADGPDPRAAVLDLLGLGSTEVPGVDRGHVLDRLQDGVADPASQLMTVFAWSLSARSPAQSRALHLLALHPGSSFDSHAAGAILGTPPAQTRTLLDALSGQNLLQRPWPGRYRLHDLLRTWVSGLVTARLGAAEVHEAADRLARYYLVAADSADRVLLPQRGRPPLDPGLGYGAPPAFPNGTGGARVGGRRAGRVRRRCGDRRRDRA